MRALPLALSALALLAGLAMASLSAEEDASPERAGQLRADLHLIEAAVDSGLVLAAEEDPLKRAKTCSELADRLAKEARRAAGAKETVRAADLGRYLQSLLERGVAANLNQAHANMAEGEDSARMPEVRSVGEKTLALMVPLMEDLERSAGPDTPDMRAAVRGLSQARAAVEKAVKTRPHRKGNSKKKKTR
jgi:hypothetical protein